MKYVVESAKSVAQAGADLEAAVVRHDFGVLHVLDLKSTLQSKGVAFPHECRIYEICNPKIAANVLKQDMSLNMALPCRISVYEEHGRTKIGMLAPQALLGMLTKSTELDQIAAEVEDIAIAIISESK
jgi:uncharacterized protein (DUF302 family)